MVEGERGAVEKCGFDFRAIIERSDGSQIFIIVGREDLIVNKGGSIVGVIYASSKENDVLVDIYIYGSDIKTKRTLTVSGN